MRSNVKVLPGDVTAPIPSIRYLRRYSRPQWLRVGTVLCMLIVIVVVLWAIFPTLFTSFSPDKTDLNNVLRSPSGTHWFGTDELGRDVFTRVVYGARLSILTTLIAVAIGFVLGVAIGLVSGFTGGFTDSLLMRIVDVFLAFPLLLMAMALVTIMGFGAPQVAIAVGIAMVGSLARVMRAEVLRVSQHVYVAAARASGRRPAGVILRHVLPNALGPVIALAVLGLGNAILAIASLSFLGFGAPPPTPEWGSMVAAGQQYLSSAWWICTLPGLTIALVVVSINRLSRRLFRGGAI